MQQFASKRVLVTGATGFIGRHLLDHLARFDCRSYAVSRVPHPPSSSSVRWYQGDLGEPSTARELMQAIKPDFVFHLASHVVGTRGVDAVLPTFQCNLMSTVNLLTAATEVGCTRIILSGSQEEPLPGDSEIVPCSPYAITKWATGAYARMFHILYRAPVVFLRIFMVYGPGQRNLEKLIPYVILSMLNGKAPQLMSGERPVDWVYVDDVVEGLLASAYAPDVEGKTIDIGSGQLVTVRSVVERLAHFAGCGIPPVFGAKPDRPLEQVRVADPEPAEKLLGWTARRPLDEGLKRTVSWYERRAKTREEDWWPPGVRRLKNQPHGN